MNTTIEQLELGVRGQIRNGSRNVREERQRRARWWFNRMRVVVNMALPARPSVPPRAEQTCLKLQQGILL
jgi:hypothetical protein